MPVTSAAATAPGCPPIMRAIRRVVSTRRLSIQAPARSISPGGSNRSTVRNSPKTEPTEPIPRNQALLAKSYPPGQAASGGGISRTRAEILSPVRTCIVPR